MDESHNGRAQVVGLRPNTSASIKRDMKEIFSLNFRKHPHQLLLFTGLILGVLSLFKPGEKTLDLHLHDTYFVLGNAEVLILEYAGFLILEWIAYHLTRRYLYSKIITWIHIITTAVTALYFAIGLELLTNEFRTPRYFDIQPEAGVRPPGMHKARTILALTFVISSFLFVFVQMFPVVNFICGLISQLVKRRKNRFN